MNQTFDFHRFGLMLKLDIAEKGKNYLMIAILLLALLLLLMLPVAFSKSYSNMKELLHYLAIFMILLFGSTLYTSSALTQFTGPSMGMAALMIPASTTEKFLSTLLLNLLFVVPFVIFFFQLHLITTDVANSKIPLAPADYRYRPMSADMITYTVYCYMIIHAGVLLGSIYFKKASYLKTAALLISAFLVISLLNIWLGYNLTDNPVTADKVVVFPFTSWKLWYWAKPEAGSNSFSAFYNVKFPQNALIFTHAVPIITILGFWAAAFLRLKEKEI